MIILIFRWMQILMFYIAGLVTRFWNISSGNYLQRFIDTTITYILISALLFIKLICLSFMMCFNQSICFWLPLWIILTPLSFSILMQQYRLINSLILINNLILLAMDIILTDNFQVCIFTCNVLFHCEFVSTLARRILLAAYQNSGSVL